MQVLPLQDVIEKVLRGDGECAKINWTLVGLSMPEWVLIALLSLALGALWLNFRRARTVN
jgi:disulfide bond formation protein DsbB